MKPGNRYVKYIGANSNSIMLRDKNKFKRAKPRFILRPFYFVRGKINDRDKGII